MSLSIRVSAALSVALLISLAGCNQGPKSTAPVKRGPSLASQQWAQLTNGLMDEYFRAQPFFAAQAGKHEFDGQLPDVSTHGLKREIARLHDAREQLSAVDPAPLEPNERFDREYFIERGGSRSLLAGEDALSVHQSLLVSRQSRSGHVS